MSASVDRPDISVVVPCFNHGLYLERLVDSVLSSRDDAIRVQIIIVDDGSTDDSRAIAVDLAKRFSEIELVLKENGGLSSARNAGIARCKGRFVHFLDADDYVLPGAYRTWLDGFARSPDADLIYGAFVVCDQVSGTTWEHSYPHAEAVLRTLIEHSPFPPHALLLRAPAAERIGHFDESISECADWDYWARAYALGLKYGRIDKPLVVYELRANSMSHSFRRMLTAAIVVRGRTKLLETDGASDSLTLTDRRTLVDFFFRQSCYATIVTQLKRGRLIPLRDAVDWLRVDPLVAGSLFRFARSHKRLIAAAAVARVRALLGLGPSRASAG